jgi:ADP-ribose pyrophosphatase YjhB (NUDIX family)
VEIRTACAGGIVLDDRRRLLVIQRGRPPAQGKWSIPGGRCLPDEDPAEACVREVAEETGLAVRVVRLAGRVELAAGGGEIYEIADFECDLIGGQLRAGDDALDARWVSRREMSVLQLAPGLQAALSEWGQLPD